MQVSYTELKKEVAEERNQTRDVRHEQDTILIKTESEKAIMQERLNSSKLEL